VLGTVEGTAEVVGGSVGLLELVEELGPLGFPSPFCESLSHWSSFKLNL
jgi:hypothetical protein